MMCDAASTLAAGAALAAVGSVRRARPLLGTLVEIGIVTDPFGPETVAATAAALAAGFAAITAVQTALSRFDPDSDVCRFERLAPGSALRLRPAGQRALRAAQALHRASGGLFDISLGSGPTSWHIAGAQLHKLSPGVRLDLGGIAKGQAVDAAVRALRRAGCHASWVNAGGDLRVFGALTLPLRLRDERSGGAHDIGSLTEGAFASSHLGPDCRSQAWAPTARPAGPNTQVSVAATCCLWADALTKIVALTGDAGHPLLARLGARAWLH